MAWYFKGNKGYVISGEVGSHEIGVFIRGTLGNLLSSLHEI
jgi:hypothetical protein